MPRHEHDDNLYNRFEWQGDKIVELELRVKETELKIIQLEKMEADKEYLLRRVERAIYFASGAVMFLQVVLKFVKIP